MAIRLYLVPSFLVGTVSPLSAALQEPAPPDLTHGGKRDDARDWLPGPTGARGWILTRDWDLTATSRQILITAVDAVSSADGILRTKDVILGVNGRLFADDARKSIGRAITAAEEKSGVLQLVRWRKPQPSDRKYQDTLPQRRHQRQPGRTC